MTKLTKKEVKKIASLAKIKLTDKEVEKFSKQLTSILDYVKKISEVDTKKINFKSHVDIENIFRDDVAAPSLSQEEAVSQAENKDGYITIPRVLDE